MAINDTGKTTQSGQFSENVQPNQMGAGSGDAHARQGSGRSGSGAITLGAGLTRQLMGIQLSNLMSGDVVGRFMATGTEVLKKFAAQNPEQIDTRLFPLNVEDNPRLGVSSILVVTKMRGEDVLAYHIVLLAGSIDPLQDKMISVGPGVGNIPVKQFVSDAIRPQMMEAVQQMIMSVAGTARALHSDSEVFAASQDPSSEEAVAKVISNAIDANVTEIIRIRAGFRDIDFTNVKSDGQLVVSPTFGNPNMEGPVRADIRIPFNVIPRGVDMNDSFNRSTRVSDVGLFMDLIFTGGPQQNFFGQQQQPEQKAIYIAQAVITSLKFQDRCYTPAAVQLALATVMSVIQNNAWVQAFKKDHTAKAKLDLKDIGAVGLDLNLENNPNGFGSKLDTSSPAFTDAYMYMMLSKIVAGVQISIDVPECGPETFYTSVFAAAADGDQRAHAALYNAMNTLTGGNFSRYFDQSQLIVLQDKSVILNGHYANGTKDIREIDYLAVLNMANANNDTGIIELWYNSLYNPNLSMAQALNDRRRVIEGIAGDAVFTGRSRRVTFNPKAIEAFSAAMGQINIDIAVQGLSNNQDGFGRNVPNTRFTNSAINAATLTGFMNRGMSGGFGNAATFGRNWHV
ncbi:MAG: hypothetical protein ACKOXF_01385 [Chitinophagaceae bacterium]